MSNFHEQLRKKRQTNNISQEQIAEHLNVTRQTISKWESGKSLPDIENAQQLATFLDISLNELLGIENHLEQTRSINKKNRLKKYGSILSIVIALIAIIFLSNFYRTYYSDPDKDILLYNSYSLEYNTGEGVFLYTTDNRKLRIRSYFDIVKYSIRNPEPENLKDVRYFKISKNDIEKKLKEDKEYAQRKSLENRK